MSQPPLPSPTPADLQRGLEILSQASHLIPTHRATQASLQFLDRQGLPLPGLEVNIRQVSQDFLFGNLLFDLVWSESPYKPDLFKERFLELFNFAVFPFYWPMYERRPGMNMAQKILPVLEWCKACGVTPKGHPLTWPYSAGVPEWLYDMPQGSVDALTQARVHNLVKGFADWIQVWDVTNEAVNHVSWPEATHPSFRARYHQVDTWRGIPVSGAFKREIPIQEAADWVEQSLRWAYAANPQATLIVNDYNQEIDPNVRQRFFELAEELLERGAPLSGLGLQVHPVNHWIWPQELWETFERYAPLGLPLHVTELHQPAWEQQIEGGWRQGMWNEEAQAEFVAQLYQLSFGHPSVVSINYWGLSDRNIWIQEAGLVDAEYRPKPVFQALKRLIKGEWLTQPMTLRTDAQGRVSWLGFYGAYEISLAAPGKKTQVEHIHLRKTTRPEWTITYDLLRP
jgi:GH35 family endo-1,4-beta-xylanase